MSLPLVIVNPTSAGGGTAEAWSQIASDLRSQFGSFQNVFTESPGHAVTLASEAARKGVKLIIAWAATGQFQKSRTAFSHPVKTLNWALCRVAPAATSDGHLKSPRKVAPLRESCAQARPDRSTLGAFRSSITMATKQCVIFWASPRAA